MFKKVSLIVLSWLVICNAFASPTEEVRVHQIRTTSHDAWALFYNELVATGLVDDNDAVPTEVLLRDVCYMERVKPQCKADANGVLKPTPELVKSYKDRNQFGDQVRLVSYREQAWAKGPGVFVRLQLASTQQEVTQTVPGQTAASAAVLTEAIAPATAASEGTPAPAAESLDRKLLGLLNRKVEENAKRLDASPAEVAANKTALEGLKTEFGTYKDQVEERIAKFAQRFDNPETGLAEAHAKADQNASVIATLKGQVAAAGGNGQKVATLEGQVELLWWGLAVVAIAVLLGWFAFGRTGRKTRTIAVAGEKKADEALEEVAEVQGQLGNLDIKIPDDLLQQLKALKQGAISQAVIEVEGQKFILGFERKLDGVLLSGIDQQQPDNVVKFENLRKTIRRAAGNRRLRGLLPVQLVA